MLAGMTSVAKSEVGPALCSASQAGANRRPHLHLGFLLDGDVTQYLGTVRYADQIRRGLGGWPLACAPHVA